MTDSDLRTGSSPRGEQKTGVNAVLLWQFAIPVLWIGLVVAISFIEAPLKFTAPGITIPLGLGIGRLVFAALNAVEGTLLIVLAIVSFWPRVSRIVQARLWWFVAIALILVAKVAIVRPPLNARTDVVLAGGEPGESPWHYIYIVLDVAILIALLVFAVLTARTILRRARLAAEPTTP